ncbi:MAG: prolyl oligopeptidase family serine peptidase [Candidatus Eisenbacteria bacterium]|nr:prolyl oligopeptidase family serine peptidase [Candidatus Eisenbacteria bacterium]
MRWISLLVAAVLAAAPFAHAFAEPVEPMPTDSVYRVPSQELVDIIDAPKTPHAYFSPDRDWMLLRERPSYPSIEELAEPELRLGGMRFSPVTNAPTRTWSYNGFLFVRIEDGEERRVTGLPDDGRFENVVWSPDSRSIAFTNTTSDGVELWTADLESAEARRVTGPVLNLVAGTAPTWIPGTKMLLATLVPEGRGDPPPAPAAPNGPVIQQNLGRVAPARTYQDLLENEHDAELFEHYMASELARVSLAGGIEPLAGPSLVWDFSPSPDGRYVLLQTLHRPFSYLVGAWRFPVRIEVIDSDGDVVHEVADLPLRDDIPIARGSVATGPRNVIWRADAPATLSWLEAQDGGDAARDAEIRDIRYQLEAPFDDPPDPLATFSLRAGGIYWGHDGLAIATEWWWPTRSIRWWRIEPGNPDEEPTLLREYSWEDSYNDPGEPVQTRTSSGRQVLLTADDAQTVYLIGQGASPEGNRPFLDSFNTITGDTFRHFRSSAPYYEEPSIVLGKDARLVVTRREAVDEVPNYFLRDLATGEVRQLTAFEDPTPFLRNIQKEIIRYEREDGIALNGTLYLPEGYSPEEDGPLPMLIWAYPREFRSADAAGQLDDSPYRFDWLGWYSSVVWLTQGFAVLDGPSMPIIGEGEEQPNDTYVEQLVSSAKAAVDEAVRRGVADPDRVAIGGHSYGAFMTANLLAHSDLFAAGLARTGAYNRTLTPFGFQSEDRTLWEAPEVYFEMSPFMHADTIDEPILIVHGDADSNPGTFPMQSERFYNALKGLGKTARFVLLPHESHSYRARESLLHLMWETEEWLERYVKNRAAGE